MDSKQPTETKDVSEPLVSTVTRGVFGGVLMGLANLVPGISGGTMLLASGIYPRFVNAIAEITTFRFRFRSLIVLITVGLSAAVGIMAFAELFKDLVLHHRWIMYSLFIGLTLGGLPVVCKMIDRIHLSLVASAAISFLAMLGFAVMQMTGVMPSQGSSGPLLFLAGLCGAIAMILPGLSGGYILLLLGQYVPILDAIAEFKSAISERDIQAALDPALGVLLPVGLGVIIGVVAVSNLIKWFLRRYQSATLGVLIGLLLGSVIGLWPFQQTVEPVIGETKIKGQLVTEENVSDFKLKDWPTEYFVPSAAQIGGGAGLVALGMVITFAVATIGGRKNEASPDDSLER